MEYVRVKDPLGRVERYVILDNRYDRVGSIIPTEGVGPDGEPRKVWQAVDRNGTNRGVWATRADAAGELLQGWE
jgi:hypothetical protein